MPQMNAGKIVLALLGTGMWLAVTPAAHAEVADARSMSMGGATAAGSLGTAYAPLYNPAAISGNGAWILPGLTVGIGNSIAGVGDLSKLLGNPTDVLGTVSSITSQVNLVDGARVEAGVRLPLVGYSGKPFGLAIAGRPVHLGLNLWGNAGANISLAGSQGIGQLITAAPSLASDITKLQSSVNTIPNQLAGSMSQVTSALQQVTQAGSDPNQFNTAITSAITAAETLKTSLSTSIAPIQTTATALTNNLGPLGTSAQNLNANVVADGHVTLALSGKVPVFKNDLVEVSVGANLKGFIMPQVATIPSPTGALSGNPSATMKVPPVAIAANLNTQPMASIATVTTAITSVNTAITSATTTIDSMISQARTAQTQAQQAAAGNPQAALQFAQSAQALTASAASFTNTANSLTQSMSGLTNIQQNLSKDLANIKMQTTSFSEVSPVGFGADLGVMAQFGEEWTAGAALENALVLWPGKEQVTDYTMSFAGSAPAFAAGNTTERSANYDRSEPRALRVGGAWRPRAVESLMVAGDVEAVFNGRPVALHLGVEKRFFKDVVGLRLGTQVGGTGFLITGGGGFKFGAFNIDLGGGVNPGLRAFQVGTGMNLAF